MDTKEPLLSKKELLEKYAISYGALYRWKRMGLIPEEWFLKKSTVTGQETFFPKTLICERVELIQSKKDALSLEELSKQLSGEEKKEAVLRLSTVFGEKSFRMSDIRQIKLLSNDGRETDLTEQIQNQL